jgi:hypothetical protein
MRAGNKRVDRLRELLTGRLTAEAFQEVADLLSCVDLTVEERREVAGLLAGAGDWLERWSAELHWQIGEPAIYSV